MGGIEIFHNFGIDDHRSINKQIRNECVNDVPRVYDIKPPLLFHVMPGLTQFNCKRIFIGFFTQARLEGV